jgi:predicted N-formylglutamate amidohydrolase
MLHSTIYNEGLPREAVDAYRARDMAYFHRRISELAVRLINAELDEEDRIRADLQIHLGLHDALHTGGQASTLIMDFINV